MRSITGLYLLVLSLSLVSLFPAHTIVASRVQMTKVLFTHNTLSNLTASKACFVQTHIAFSHTGSVTLRLDQHVYY